MRGRRNKQRVAINRKTKVDWQKTRSEETKTPRIQVKKNDEGTPKQTKLAEDASDNTGGKGRGQTDATAVREGTTDRPRCGRACELCVL